MPPAKNVQQELAKAKSTGDFFGKEGIYACLFFNTLEKGCKQSLRNTRVANEAKGRNSVSNRNRSS